MTGVEQALVFIVGGLVGAAIMEFRKGQNTRDTLLTLAGQFDQLQSIMHGYVNDMRSEFEKQLDLIETKYDK